MWFRTTLLAALVGQLFALSNSPESAPKGTVCVFISSRDPYLSNRLPAIYEARKVAKKAGLNFEICLPDAHENEQSVRAMQFEYRLPEAKLDLAAETAKKHAITGPAIALLTPEGNARARIDLKSNLPSTFSSLVLGHSKAALKPQLNPSYRFKIVHIPKSVTYYEHVAPILNRSCVPCHQKGEIAPFELTNYALAKKWSPMILRVTHSKTMPPFKAMRGYLPLKSDIALSAAELELLAKWDEQGNPEGVLKSNAPILTPPKREKPDIILDRKRTYRVMPDIGDQTRILPFKTNFSTTKYLKKVLILPGDRRVVHHVVAFLDTLGHSLKLDGEKGEVGYSASSGMGFAPLGALSGYAPGFDPIPAPKGSAYELPPGATIALQVHYSSVGIPVDDNTRIALYFADEKPKELAVLGIMQSLDTRVEPGDKNGKLHMEFTFDEGTTVYGILPHMHNIATGIRVRQQNPKQNPFTVVALENWNFGWQQMYEFEKPLVVPKDATWICDVSYDNSADNPNNPNRPPKLVVGGFRTKDEMLLLAYLFTIPFEKP